jgi:hypothetical protein
MTNTQKLPDSNSGNLSPKLQGNVDCPRLLLATIYGYSGRSFFTLDASRCCQRVFTSMMPEGAPMPAIEPAEERTSKDYSCEIISFVVLLGLSALSHFWFIAIGISFGSLMWAFIRLLRQMISWAAKTRIVPIRTAGTAACEPSTQLIWKSGISATQNTPESGLLARPLPSTICVMSRNRVANQ